MSLAGFMNFLGLEGIEFPVLFSRVFFSFISVLITIFLVAILSIVARFTSTREQYSSSIVTIVSLVTAIFCAFFLREGTTNFLVNNMYGYKDIAVFMIDKINGDLNVFEPVYWPLFIATSAVITVISAVLSLLIILVHLGVGEQWTKRGAVIKSAKGKMSKRLLKIGGSIIPTNIETRGFAIFGTTGSGKTQAFMVIAEVARKRGQRLIAIDPDGDLMSRFFKEGDVILNPQDSRTVEWSIFADLKHISECVDIAESIIPEGTGENKHWHTSARILTASILEGLISKNKLTTKDFLHICLFADIKEIITLVQGTEGERTMSGSNTKGRDSILSIVAESLRAWRSLDQAAGKEAFSLRDWMSDDNNESWLWMPYSASSSAASASLRRTFIDIMMRELMTLGEDSERRIWFLLDELHEHGQLDILPRATARGRKYGLVHVLGIHAISQLKEIYGEHQATSIMATTGNKLILKQSDPETAEYCSLLIGDRETERKEKSRTQSEKGMSRNTSYHHQIDRTILPADLQNKIQDMSGFLLLSGQGIFKAKLEFLKNKYPVTFSPEIKKEHSVKIGQKLQVKNKDDSKKKITLRS